MTFPSNSNLERVGGVGTVVMPAGIASAPRARRGTTHWRRIRRSWRLYVLLFLPTLWLLIFAYVPMYGVQIAFRDYNVVAGITGSPWVGLEHFNQFFNSYNFWPILRNTLILNLY